MRLIAFFLLLCPLMFSQDQPPKTGNLGGAASGQDSALTVGGILALIYGCACVVGVAFLAIEVASLIFVYKDATARGAEPLLWLAIVFFTHFVGLIVWLFVRPPLPNGPPPVPRWR